MPRAKYLLVGDFNAYHPAWGGLGTAMDPEGELILKVIDHYDI
jgi:hypothetical protein